MFPGRAPNHAIRQPCRAPASGAPDHDDSLGVLAVAAKISRELLSDPVVCHHRKHDLRLDLV